MYKKSSLLLLLVLAIAQQANAFCGFYVATTDVALTNKTSQVIFVRDGDHTVITMSSDFEGEAKDFAMVVPVPEVLKESDIRVVQQYIFDKFSQYTAPRLVEYYDMNPCRQIYDEKPLTGKDAIKGDPTTSSRPSGKETVKVEAKYTVGEYDILILSATESGGLKTWLTDNGYKLPKGAEEVLDPYIKDGMKFFVVKVNLEQQKALGVQTLRPLQIQFNTSKFMLPIRLGMANATAPQDMLVYSFTRKGRVETSNYRTTKLPTDRDIPEFVQSKAMFADFYKAMFEKAWAKQGKNTVMLEYAWDISSQQPVKCDPCAGPQLTFAELREAGVWWINPNGGGYSGDLFITRLHVRYARKTFPQDLTFIHTPDKSPFQGRYAIHHAAVGDLDCAEANAYKVGLRKRRQKELDELVGLTGWNAGKWASYVSGIAVDVPTQIQKTHPGSTASTAVDSTATEAATVSGSNAETASGIQNEAQSVAASEAYLQDAAQVEQPFLTTKGWLFVLAGAMFIVGIAVRFIGRKKKE